MNREDLAELHYITPIANIPSILTRGILSHRQAVKLAHKSVAMQQVQDRRAPKVVPGGRSLHDYANLYINARNPMMFTRKQMHRDLSVLRICPDVLDLTGVIVTDMNAARGIARFRPASTGLAFIEREMVFADDWRHPGDRFTYARHQGIMCAEVLVPDRVPPEQILGVYVSCPETHAIVQATAPRLSCEIRAKIFFVQ